MQFCQDGGTTFILLCVCVYVCVCVLVGGRGGGRADAEYRKVKKRLRKLVALLVNTYDFNVGLDICIFSLQTFCGTVLFSTQVGF